MPLTWTKPCFDRYCIISSSKTVLWGGLFVFLQYCNRKSLPSTAVDV